MITRAFLLLLCSSVVMAQHVPQRVYGTGDGLAHRRVTALAQDGRGFLWVGSEGGLDRFDGRTFVSFSRIEGKPLGPVHALAVAGDLLEVTTGTGVRRLRLGVFADDAFEQTGSGRTVATPRAREDAGTPVLMRDRERNVWRASEEGLAVSRPDRSLCMLRGRELPSDLRAVVSIAVGTDGSLWFATRGAGALRIGPVTATEQKPARIERVEALPTADVTAVLPLGPTYILFGTECGLLVREGTRTHRFTTAQGLPSDTIRALVASRLGRGVWIATAGGLVRWDGRNLRTFTTREGLPSNNILCIAEDPFGTLWVGTDAGACTIVPAAQYAVKPVETVDRVRVTAVYIDQSGRPWIACEGRGIVHHAASSIVRITHDDGLAGRTIVFILEDSTGAMYFGSNAGVSVLPAANRRHFEPDERIRGFMRAEPVVRAFHRAISIHTLTTASGLHGNEMHAAALRDSAGRLWFGGVDGTTRYTPPARDVVRGARVLLAGLQIGDTATVPAASIELPTDDAVFAVQCILPSFRTGQVRYYFRLEGHEYRWHESLDGRMLYTGLKPGTYSLRVRATTGEGIWYSDEDVLTVHVATPLTDRVWIQFLVLAAAVAAGWFAHAHRVRHRACAQ